MKNAVFNGNAEETSQGMRAEGLEYGISLGRRAPMHRMHVDCILEIARSGLKPIIGIGSINGPDSPLYDPVRNPLTIEQQKEQFRRALPAIDYNEARMITLEDTPDDKTWLDNFAQAVKDRGLDGKTVVHFRSKAADAAKEGEAIQPLSAYSASLVEKGLAVWQSYNSNAADDNVSASAIRAFDLENLTPAQRGVIAAPDYLISIAREARANNPDKALLEANNVPLTVLDLALDRMYKEAGIRTAVVIAAAESDGPVNPHTLTNAATDLVKARANGGTAPAKKPLLVLGNSVSEETADFLKTAGAFSLAGASIGKFQSDEPFVELFYGEKANFAANAEKIKGAKAFVVQSTAEPVADNFLHLLMTIHALKFYGAAEVTAVVPFVALSREDRAFDQSFWVVGADLAAKEIKAAGADRMITFTMHSQAGAEYYRNQFGDAFTNISATDVLKRYLESKYRADAANLVFGAPDGADKPKDEGQRRATDLATSITGTFNKNSLFLIAKEHVAANETKCAWWGGDVKGKDCVLIDDMVDGGGTALNAARLLKQQGAKSVTVAFTHALLTKSKGTALERLLTAKDGDKYVIDSLVMTDSVPEAADKLAAFAKQYPLLAQKVDTISLGPAILAEIRKTLAAAPAAANNNAPAAQAKKADGLKL